MPKRMLIDAVHPEEMRVVITDDRQILDFDFITAGKKQLKGNIYLAKITRVEPSLQAAFVEYGGGKQGFLPFAEIHPDYYQIPMSDRRRLMAEAEAQEDDLSEPPHGDAPEASSGEAEDYLPENMGESDAQSDNTPAPALPDFAAIPEQTYNEAPAETPAPEASAMPERSIAFTTSEVVAAETREDETLADRFSVESEEPAAQPAENGEAPAKAEGVETLASEEEEMRERPKRNNFYRRYKIQEVIKRNQVVLVQVIKEERGNKGVSLTTYLSLPGRYCVLMPNSPKDGGVSRKISDGENRKRLKEIMAELKLARGMSVIIRTAGMDRSKPEIRRDFDYLVKLWNQIREDTLGSTAPALIYEESDLVKRAIRDQYTSDMEEVMIQGDGAYRTARDFMKMLLPSHTPRVKQYKESMPLFYAYGIEDQLMQMHDPIVKLKSGGYIVINPTEALISIDVNSGRATGERNIEETAYKTNLEAAAEVARQLRLRDLAGLIVIDFIDMMESRNRRNVERALKDALKSDRAKIQLGRISPFGLLEMSRQRLRPSIAETSNVQCPHCAGRGTVRSNESLSVQIARALEKEAATGSWQLLKLNAPEHVVLHLLNHRRALIEGIEERYGVQILVTIDHSLTATAFTVEKTRRNQGGSSEGAPEGRPRRERGERGGRGRGRDREDRNRQPAEEPIEAADIAEDETGGEAEETENAEGGENGNGPRRRRRRGGRGRNRTRREGSEGDASPEEGMDAFTAPTTDEELTASLDAPMADAVEGEPAPRGNRERGPRGGSRRRWRGREGDAEETANSRPILASDNGPGDARQLPEFTRQPVEKAPRAEASPTVITPFPQPGEAIPQVAPTHRPEGTPARKGWWQRMIELD